MPIDLTKIPKSLIEAATDGRLVLLIGSGVSRQTKSKESAILPNWAELVEEITHIARAQGMSAGDEALIDRLTREGKFLIAAQELKDRIPSDLFEHYIRRRFQRDLEPGRIHYSLFKLRTPLLMTTNYDLLLEAAYAQAFGMAARVATPHHPAEVFRSLKMPWTQDAPVIFKLHGTIVDPESIVLTEHDYHRLIYRMPHYRVVLRTIFMTRIVLMLGFSFSDPDIADVVAEGKVTGAGGDFIVLPKADKVRFERRRLSMNFGVDVIEYEPSNDQHPELLELVEYLAGFCSARKREVSPY